MGNKTETKPTEKNPSDEKWAEMQAAADRDAQRLTDAAKERAKEKNG